MSNYLKDLEDSRLLFKTFCDGLMYGMFFYHGEALHRVTSIEGLDETVNGVYPIKECKPCLRSMSSMTEEEREEFKSTQYEELINQYPCSAASTEIKTLSYTAKTFDWLNKKHFDYRGLIPMGLALVASEGIYKQD